MDINGTFPFSWDFGIFVFHLSIFFFSSSNVAGGPPSLLRLRRLVGISATVYVNYVQLL